MCKFESSSAPGFRAVSTDIRQWVLEAPAFVSMRWEVEEQEMATRMRNEIHERMSPYVSQLLMAGAASSASTCSAFPSRSPSPGFSSSDFDLSKDASIPAVFNQLAMLDSWLRHGHDTAAVPAAAAAAAKSTAATANTTGLSIAFSHPHQSERERHAYSFCSSAVSHCSGDSRRCSGYSCI